MGLVKGVLFFGFVTFGLLAAYSARKRADDRRAINLFIVYTVVLGMAVGLSQRDVWPFAAWPLVAGTVSRPLTHPRIVAIDAEGREYQIDYRAWEPLEFDELMAWKEQNFSRLERSAQDRVAAFLLGVVEQARQQWSSGRREHYLDYYLGPLSAPLFLGHPDYWETDAGIPGQVLVGLRFYDETWDVEERARDPSKISRRLIYEYRKS
jgi:hypothetical protein